VRKLINPSSLVHKVQDNKKLKFSTLFVAVLAIGVAVMLISTSPGNTKLNSANTVKLVTSHKTNSKVSTSTTAVKGASTVVAQTSTSNNTPTTTTTNSNGTSTTKNQTPGTTTSTRPPVTTAPPPAPTPPKYTFGPPTGFYGPSTISLPVNSTSSTYTVGTNDGSSVQWQAQGNAGPGPFPLTILPSNNNYAPVNASTFSFYINTGSTPTAPGQVYWVFIWINSSTEYAMHVIITS